MKAEKVLVIDNDERRRHDLQVVLDFLGQPAVISGSADWQRVAADNCESPADFVTVILADCTRQQSLKQRLHQIWEWDKTCPVILAGKHAQVDESWDSHLRHLVIGSLALPPTYAKLMDILHRADRYRRAASSQAQQGRGRPVHLFRSLVGSSRKIQDLRKVMAQVAERDIPVLINGESGTGKEVVARNLHYRSAKSAGPFVPMDCRAIPAELLEVELFGQSGPDAFGERVGRVHLADGGTLFIDGLGELRKSSQIKLLRLLQDKTYERVGSNASRTVDLRLIAASHEDLERKVREGDFHEELFYLLSVFPIDMPPLRERSEDVPLLVNELVSRLEGENRGSIRFNSAAIMSLCRHHWSGNVRELATLVERMAISHPYGVIGVNDLPPKYRHLDIGEEGGSERATVEQVTTGYQPSMVSMSDRALLPESGIDLKEYLNTLERNLIQQALADTGGVVARAADHLAIRRTTLVEKMRKYGLQK